MTLQLILILHVVILYKVTADTELANSEPLILGEIQGGLGSCKPLFTTFLSTDQYIISFYVFLRKGTLFNVYC